MSLSRTRVSSVDTTQLENARKHQSNAGILEYWAGAFGFAHYSFRGIRAFTEGYSRFVFFPLIAAFAFYDMASAWSQAYAEKRNGALSNFSLGNAAVKTAVFLASTLAIVGGMAASALFQVAGPALVVAAIGLKAVWDLGNAAYNYYQSTQPIPAGLSPAEEQTALEERAASLFKAKDFAVSGLVNSVITVSIALLSFTGLPLIYGMLAGLAASLIGATSVALNKRRNAQVAPIVEGPAPVVSTDLSSTASMHHGLGVDNKLHIVYGVEPVVATVKAIPVTAEPTTVPLRPVPVTSATRQEEEESVVSRGMGMGGGGRAAG